MRRNLLCQTKKTLFSSSTTLLSLAPLRFKGRMYLVRVLKEYITHDRSSEHASYKIKARARGTPTTHRRSFPEKQLY